MASTPLRDVTNMGSPSPRGGGKAPDRDAEVRSSGRQRVRPDASGSEPLECLLWALPEEVIVEILLRLDVPDICMLARTCTQVGRPIAHPRVWESRTLRLVRAPPHAWSSFGQRLALVRALKIEPAVMGDAQPSAAGARLAHMVTARCRAHSAYCPLGAPVHGVPQLTSCGGLTDVGVSLLARMLSNVETLSVAQMGHLTFASIARLIAECPRLEHLDASSCTLVAEPARAFDDAADAVAALPLAHPRLLRLNVSRTKLSNVGLARLLEMLPALEELSLNHCEHLDAALSDAADSPEPIGLMLAAHAATHGALRKVSVVGSISVRRASVEALERAGVHVETDDSFTDAFLQQRPGAEGLFALISTYYNM